MRKQAIFVILISLSITSGCFESDDSDSDQEVEYPSVSREDKIPEGAVKGTPNTDSSPLVLHSDLFMDPVPLKGEVNTAGAEDSPFITEDGETLYFFFTPDVDVPPEKQILDDVTGIWFSELIGKKWSKPKRVWLQDPDKLALDGAHWVGGDEIWFGSAREGYAGVNLFTAERMNGEWGNWEYAGDLFNKEYEVGELHKVGDTIYFHSGRDGGKGEYDIWTTTYSEGGWTEPVNIEVVNSPQQDSLPWVSNDEKEMFLTRAHQGTPSIFRSVKENGSWTEPELILSSFAGEPTLDLDGNLYFVHHYYEKGKMIEADIYFCERIK